MSFTLEVAKGLVDLQSKQKKSCCHKALICGLMYGCVKKEDGKLRASFLYDRSAELARDVLNKRFSDSTASVEKKVRCGRTYYFIETSSKSVVSAMDMIDSDSVGSALRDIVGFRCDACKEEFLRGLFLSVASVNNPQKGYHLEFSVANERRAQRLADFLTEVFETPKIIYRKNCIGLYYKSGEKISDLLYMVGAASVKFQMTDLSMEREARNIVNRSTNCVTHNISRSVEATRKQIEAIEYLRAVGALDKLSESLRYTAELRLKYDSSALSELAALHEPSITKSGLNQRLTKIIEIAYEIKNSAE